ncbi:MAG: hypothetical protein GY938_15050, partial [Ketobacter sp.]|nr:hypothetical protein [Ketobacter sp.]
MNAYYSGIAQAFMEEYELDMEQIKDQKLMSELIDEGLAEALWVEATTPQKARLNACSAKGAAAWIAAIPTYANKIPAQEFLVIMRMWLGVKLHNP